MACMCRSGLEGLNNGMMASVPGLPLWGLAAQVLQERAHAEGAADWEKGPIYQTGPRVLGEVQAPALTCSPFNALPCMLCPGHCIGWILLRCFAAQHHTRQSREPGSGPGDRS